MAAVAAAVLFIVPEQSGNSASFEAALPDLTAVSDAAARSGEAVPTPETPRFAIDPAVPFVASYGDAASPARAEDCLTQAIYYEGALEPAAGQRAIAQVVLNRVRHPEYPNSVCGVVFEGQHLSTGCQFTFTCDGSRARAPMLNLWRKANLVAKAALGGTVAKEVGLSTHYHADYVQPYWSRTLDYTGQIGRHVFYRWRGNAGRPQAFSSAYAGREPLIAEWSARAAVRGEEQALMTAGEPDGSAADGFGGMRALDARPAAPVLFKARPLRLATEEDRTQ
ncbi:cell wall hydrolase [Erythrobacter sp. NFXS35]